MSMRNASPYDMVLALDSKNKTGHVGKVVRTQDLQSFMHECSSCDTRKSRQSPIHWWSLSTGHTCYLENRLILSSEITHKWHSIGDCVRKGNKTGLITSSQSFFVLRLLGQDMMLCNVESARLRLLESASKVMYRNWFGRASPDEWAVVICLSRGARLLVDRRSLCSAIPVRHGSETYENHIFAGALLKSDLSTSFTKTPRTILSKIIPGASEIYSLQEHYVQIPSFLTTFTEEDHSSAMSGETVFFVESVFPISYACEWYLNCGSNTFAAYPPEKLSDRDILQLEPVGHDADSNKRPFKVYHMQLEKSDYLYNLNGLSPERLLYKMRRNEGLAEHRVEVKNPDYPPSIEGLCQASVPVLPIDSSETTEINQELRPGTWIPVAVNLVETIVSVLWGDGRKEDVFIADTDVQSYELTDFGFNVGDLVCLKGEQRVGFVRLMSSDNLTARVSWRDSERARSEQHSMYELRHASPNFPIRLGMHVIHPDHWLAPQQRVGVVSDINLDESTYSVRFINGSISTLDYDTLRNFEFPLASEDHSSSLFSDESDEEGEVNWNASPAGIAIPETSSDHQTVVSVIRSLNQTIQLFTEDPEAYEIWWIVCAIHRVRSVVFKAPLHQNESLPNLSRFRRTVNEIAAGLKSSLSQFTGNARLLEMQKIISQLKLLPDRLRQLNECYRDDNLEKLVSLAKCKRCFVDVVLLSKLVVLLRCAASAGVAGEKLAEEVVEKLAANRLWIVKRLNLILEKLIACISLEQPSKRRKTAAQTLLDGQPRGRFIMETEAPASHAFSHRQFEMTNFMKEALELEKDVLGVSLPPNVTLKSYRNRADLFSLMVAGAAGTVLEDVLFFLDIQLPPTYPIDPPRVFHRSLSDYEIVPTLAVDGCVRISLLDFQIEGQWSPRQSTLLQLIQQLEEEIANGQLKHKLESCVVLMAQAMADLLKSPVQHFRTEIKHHFEVCGQKYAAQLDNFVSKEITHGAYLSLKETIQRLKDLLP